MPIVQPTFADFDFELPDPGASPWIVEGYRIEISSHKSLDGGNIELRAREVVFTEQGQLSVDGSPKPQATIRDHIPTSPGAPGLNGPDGETGANGGSITIICERLIGPVSLSAKGGTGQQGANGSSGIRGDQGPAGSAGTPGGDGLPGGAAGRGGTGGKGGAGGSINIFAVDASKASIVLKDVSGGAGGGAGAKGNPGEGGPPGTEGWPPNSGVGHGGPGSNHGGNLMAYDFHWTGNAGHRGQEASDNIKGDQGSAGLFTSSSSNDAESKLRAAFSDIALSLFLTNAEAAYYNRQPTDTAELLTFLRAVSEDKPS